MFPSSIYRFVTSSVVWGGAKNSLMEFLTSEIFSFPAITCPTSQSILEFVYLGEVNVEQDRLQSFLKTAELMRIKGLTDGLPDSGGGGGEPPTTKETGGGEGRRSSPSKKETDTAVVASLLRPTAKRPSR